MVNSQVLQNNIPVHQNMVLSLENEHGNYNGNSCDSLQTSILKYVGNENIIFCKYVPLFL
jgi:hypothetical protein